MTKAKFAFSVNREPSWKIGYQTAMKDAIAFLHRRAEEFNDGTAKHIVNSAATNLGWAWREHETRQDREWAVGDAVEFQQAIDNQWAPATVISLEGNTVIFETCQHRYWLDRRDKRLRERTYPSPIQQVEQAFMRGDLPPPSSSDTDAKQ